MLREHRFQQIAEALTREPFLAVKDLAQQLRVSDATVRRDLEALHLAGRLERTRGGAMLRKSEASPNGGGDGVGDTLDHVTSFEQRAAQRMAVKERIGAAAAALVEDGENVLIAGGTTCYAAAKHLRRRRVSVVTNSLPTAALLGATLGVDVLVTGGMIYPKHDILIGPQLKQTLDSVRAGDWLLLGAAGADEVGFYDSNHWEVEAQHELMARANRVALLLDSTKFGRRDMLVVAGWERIDVLVTDAAPTKKLAAALRAANVRVIGAKQD